MSKWAKMKINKGDEIKAVKGKSVRFCKDVPRVRGELAKGERGFKYY